MLPLKSIVTSLAQPHYYYKTQAWFVGEYFSPLSAISVKQRFKLQGEAFRVPNAEPVCRLLDTILYSFCLPQIPLAMGISGYISTSLNN